MTPKQYRKLAKDLNLNPRQMGEELNLTQRMAYYYYSGEKTIKGPLKRLLEYVLKYGVMK